MKELLRQQEEERITHSSYEASLQKQGPKSFSLIEQSQKRHFPLFAEL